ncbi:MAG: aspartate dehydrogenase [Pseudomonadota bacterium]|nr:aspartate dehydrogenase [Pseudomonadota bacterium]
MAIKIVVIGYGAIGRMVVEELGKLGSSVAVCGVLVKPSRLAETRAALSERVAVLTDAVDALRLNPDLIVECAGQEAVVAYGEEILAAGCDLMVIAIGALADDDLRARLVDAARGTGARLTLPAGAIAGIDGLAALRLGGLDRVRYVSTKPPVAWKGTPADGPFDLTAMTEKTTIFAGPARDAARLYPKNANIAAIVALAGLGLDKTEIELIADPDVKENIGRIEAEGRYGRLNAELSGHAVPNNPKTSACTAFSIVNAVQNCSNTVILG